jgi:hypothetical protein
MSWWLWTIIVVLALVLVALVSTGRDINRYLRIRRM